ncbi:MAG: GNAT family N-acetyltransferase [Stenotrophomonas maltophilia]
MRGLTLAPASVADTDVLFQLMQFYYFEASAWSGEQIAADGTYDCARADVAASLRDAPGWARLLWLDGVLCGFVLVDEVAFQGARIPELADLFVLPTHRGKGIAREVVARLVVPGSGRWLLATFANDTVAHAFWRRNLPKMGLTIEMPAPPDDADFHFFLISAA